MRSYRGRISTSRLWQSIRPWDILLSLVPVAKVSTIPKSSPCFSVNYCRNQNSCSQKWRGTFLPHTMYDIPNTHTHTTAILFLSHNHATSHLWWYISPPPHTHAYTIQTLPLLPCIHCQCCFFPSIPRLVPMPEQGAKWPLLWNPPSLQALLCSAHCDAGVEEVNSRPSCRPSLLLSCDALCSQIHSSSPWVSFN